ncbi:VIT1/CCC1 transporter family protein [Streptomyces laurentii]|uniref:VIT1/CCC1 transporter family protein n=1 Tax=Streptomyces laurentii TaxID=39478 RepID=UPI0033E922BB
MRADPLAAHLRDELGHSEHTAAWPPQAAIASASGGFLTGGLVPSLGLLATTTTGRLWLIVAVSLCGPAVAGLLAARVAGTTLLRPMRCVGCGPAMAVTAAVGRLAHASGI